MRVLAEGHLAQQEVAQRVGAELRHEGVRPHDVPGGLGHLLLVAQPPAVRPHRRREREARGEQEGRPVDGVEAEDVLADQVDAASRRVLPELPVEPVVPGAEAERRDVVGERVEPDVDDLPGPPGKRDPPLDLRPRDGEVGQPPAHEGQHLGPARLRPDELRVLLVVLEERRRVLREAEEDVLLRLPQARRAVDRAPLLRVELLLRVEGLAAGAVPPLVLRGVEVAGLLDAGDDRLDPRPVPALGRADEVVVGDLELLPEVVVAGDDPVGERDRRDPLPRRRLLDVLAVLVGPGQEARLLADQPVVPRRRVRDDGRVDVPDVGQVVDVVDRRRRVEGPHGRREDTPRRRQNPQEMGTPMARRTPRSTSSRSVSESGPPRAEVDRRCLGRVVICSHLSTESCGRPPVPRFTRTCVGAGRNVVLAGITRTSSARRFLALTETTRAGAASVRLSGNRHPIEASPLRRGVHFQASPRDRLARSAQRESSFPSRAAREA